jgi:hypothetical protein
MNALLPTSFLRAFASSRETHFSLLARRREDAKGMI